MSPIVLKLSPRYQELKERETYTHEQVIDILCDFAQSVFTDIPPLRIREIITENFEQDEE